MTLEQFIEKYKPYNIAVYYNEYKVNCESVKEYIEVDYIEDDVLDKEECIKTGNVYELYVYPDNSVGFYRVICSKLEIAINVMSKVIDKIKEKERNDKICQEQRKQNQLRKN